MSRRCATCNGDKATFAEVFDELDTLPFLFSTAAGVWTTPTVRDALSRRSGDEGRRPARARHAGAGREALAGDDGGWQSW